MIEDATEPGAGAAAQLQPTEFFQSVPSVPSVVHAWDHVRRPRSPTHTVNQNPRPYGHTLLASINLSIGVRELEVSDDCNMQSIAATPVYDDRVIRNKTCPAAQYGEAIEVPPVRA